MPAHIASGIESRNMSLYDSEPGSREISFRNLLVTDFRSWHNQFEKRVYFVILL